MNQQQTFSQIQWFSLVWLPMLCLTACVSAHRCKIPEPLLDRVSELRGMPFLSPVDCRYAPASEIKTSITKAFEESNPEERLRYEELSWKLLGLIPENYPYKNKIIQLFTERIAGYYDPLLKLYVLPQDILPYQKERIMMHELTHALQDQYYDLQKLTHGDWSTDELLARLAFIEGDAHRVLFRGLGELRCEQQSQAADEEMLRKFIDSTFFHTARSEPLAIELMTTFPYTYGLQFACRMHRERDGAAYEKVFDELPQRTAEIMHPLRSAQRSGKRESPSSPLSADSVGRRTKIDQGQGEKENVVFHDSLGELLTFAYLATYLDMATALRAAAGLRGDPLSLVESDARYKLTWRTTWDSAEDAAEFYLAIKEALCKRFSRESKATYRIQRSANIIYLDIEVRRPNHLQATHSKNAHH